MDRTILVGRVCSNPSMIDSNGACYTKFALANSIVDSYGNEEIRWHDIIATGKQARICCEHLNKGDLCRIEGYTNGGSVIVEQVVCLPKSKY